MNKTLLIILIVVIAGIGFQWGAQWSRTQYKNQIDTLEYSYNESTRLLYESEQRKKMYMELAARDYLKIDSLQQQINKRDSVQQKIRIGYAKEIKKATTYTISQLDSFFIARYPSPTLRADSNFNSLESETYSSGLDTLRFGKIRMQAIDTGRGRPPND